LSLSFDTVYFTPASKFPEIQAKQMSFIAAQEKQTVFPFRRFG